MNRIYNIFLLVIFLTVFLCCGAAPAYEDSYPQVGSYLLIDADTGQVLAAKNQNQKVYPASTTKLMTGLLLLEQKGLEGEVTVGDEIAGLAATSSLMGLEQGETVTVKDLFYGLMVSSGNDAAMTIAKYVSGGVDEFCALMNSRAAELGMGSTNFANPDGVFINEIQGENDTQSNLGKNHFTTAEDMSKLVMEAVKHQEILDSATTKTYTLAATNVHTQPREIENSNRLIYTSLEKPDEAEFLYEYATGIKTGLIANIKPENDVIPLYGCLLASAERNDMRFAALIYADISENAYDRWRIAKDLFDYGFENYQKVDLAQYIEAVDVTEQAADGSTVRVTGDPSPYIPPPVLMDNEMANQLASGVLTINRVVDIPALVSSVADGTQVGTATYMLGDIEVCSVALSAGDSSSASIDPLVSAAPEQTPYQSQAVSLIPERNPDEPNTWWVLIVIPGAVVGVLFALRRRKLAKSKKRKMRHYRQTPAKRSARRRG